MKKHSIELRELMEEDKYLLLKWLTDPQVLRYYEGRDNSFTLSKVKASFFDENLEETRCIIIYEDTPIGYIQFYPIGEEERELYGYRNLEDAIFGMDQFIGETEFWDRGLGTDLVNLTVERIIREKQATRIVLDPQTWNERAIRCYEKCGFQKVKLLPEREWHEGQYRDCWLMEYVVDGE
ncbi:GNAT family N-acetyltransferase [Sporosarcina aquimarina]|uniref:GNAT family N-acetyltransferase n=1 Tax=Sporosarcina aquimarina TaxID=114975 RepID=UPI002041C460|nr:GNAT family N-acetyltransferase [Sporosarcina aquimarina]MCM3756357.1 GNAT family N-acetyltransferase [Sporosarcina aquimarina]